MLQRFGCVFPIENSAGVPGRDHDEEVGCKSDEVRKSPLVVSPICTEVVVARIKDEDKRLKMNKTLGQIWKAEGVGRASCFEDQLTFGAHLESPASSVSPKSFSPSSEQCCKFLCLR